MSLCQWFGHEDKGRINLVDQCLVRSWIYILVSRVSILIIQGTGIVVVPGYGTVRKYPRKIGSDGTIRKVKFTILSCGRINTR